MRVNRAARTTEKIPICDLCCTGLYNFRSVDDFRYALAAERASPSSAELYVAPIYNHLIRLGRDIRYTVIERDEVIFCGVPQEYDALANDRNSLMRAFDNPRSVS